MKAGTHDFTWSPSRPGEGWRADLWRALRTRWCWIFSDESLVRRARGGDHAAFDGLVARYRKRLCTLARTSAGNEGETGEGRREMVLSAFTDIDSFRTKCIPGTWLYLHGFRAVFEHLTAPAGK